MRTVAGGLFGLLLGLAMLAASAGPLTYPDVRPGVALAFPRDHGAHPQFRTEWWYVTGWLETNDHRQLGFQVTFFRSRPDIDTANPSAFAPRQILFAHAALSDAGVGHLLHDQRVARAGFGIAAAREGDTDVRIDHWTLARDAASGRFHTRVDSADFGLDLDLAPTQPVLAQGDAGYSRKSPDARAASYYYSVPQLRVSGSVRRAGKTLAVHGTAWLDREWSSAYLDARAAGWDWVGLNLDDGGALMAFRMRDRHGAPLWAGATLRAADGRVEHFGPDDVRFETLRSWRSPRSGAIWPVQQRVVLRDSHNGRDGRAWTLTPTLDDQELDSRASTGTIYWEGAVRANGARGYLELTGYAGKINM